ncbi:MAG: C-GCAxxG-C-C family protein [Deltaproteobacteria bacterium]|jgi:C_GCAxxG_C_C family probable redox protein|nr:C-GCAxxG-C-C family protein [Deltaproteobacteria bacterium]
MISEQEVVAQFQQGFDCGQILLAGASEKLGMDLETAYKVAAGFGGGMGLGQVCGAVVGAIMALGLKYGHHQPDALYQKGQIMAKTVEFQQKFLKTFSSTVCRELLGHDLSLPQEMNIVMEKGLLFTFCPKVVSHSVKLLEEIL